MPDDPAAHRGNTFLAGGGTAGALVRSVDWSQTAVGPIATWPGSLRTTVGTILHSRHPMFLWWGPELVQFYNDAYLPSFGKGKHPTAMGQRGADCWQEIWPIIWPQIDDVMQRATSSWNEDHLVPIFRNGRIEEVYWTYGYSPVFDETGGVGGTLVVCMETTARVVSERRRRTLQSLLEGTVLAETPAAVFDVAASVLGQQRADVPFALIYAVGAAQAPALVRSIALDPGDAAALDASFSHRLEQLSQYPVASPLPEAVVPIDNPWPEAVTAVCVVRLAAGAQHPASGYIVFGVSPRLPFDQPYREYLGQLAEHISQAQARIEMLHVRAVMENERNNLLEQAPVATALLTGPDHVFRLANPLYRQVVGRNDIIGKSYADAFPELRDTSLRAILDRVYRTGEPFVTNEMLVPLDRTGRGRTEDCFFTFNLEPLRSATGDVYGMMAVAVDITPQVSARRVVEKAHGEREQLLHELEQAGRAKDEFLAMLGHELRNPLAPILTALQLMRLRGVQGADKERAVIDRQVRHVVRLVDDLLDVSRITRGTIQLHVERLQVNDIVAKAIEMACPLIEERRHRVSVAVPDDLPVDGDAGRLSQVLANVLTNAAKYTDPEGEIVVRAEALDGDVRLSVRDNGMGIDPAVLGRVLEPFAQERQASDRSRGGLGLGLAIVRSLVEAHGGTVALHSEGRGRGTECLIRLPQSSASRPVQVKAAGIVVPDVREDGVALLHVDDNRDAADTLADALRALGHRVRVAYDGAQALDMATDYVPDVALLDLGLPVIDGYELAARLRAQPGWDRVRLIALTGYGLQRDRVRTTQAGFDDHLVKPVAIHELDARLRSSSRFRL